MSVTTETNRTSELTTDGVVTDFDFSMLIYDKSEVQVWYKVTDGRYVELTLDTDYGVVFTDDGGTVSTDGYRAPLAAGELLIIRHLELTQQTNWIYNDNHTGQQHQDDFDRNAMRDIQMQEQLDRVLTLAIYSSTTGITVPEPVANNILGWNAGGTNLTNITPVALAVLIAEEIFETEVPELLGDLTDVTIDAPVAGDLLRYDGAAWVNYPDSNYQPIDAGLTDIAALAVTNSNFIVGDGSNWVAENGNTARTSLGLGTGDSPTLSSLTLDATSPAYSDLVLTGLTGGTVSIRPAGLMIPNWTLTLPANSGTNFYVLSTNGGGTCTWIAHDSIAGFVANEHIDHTSVSILAGTGLAGGGTIAANRTLGVDGVLEDLDTLGAAASDGQFIVATGAGAFAYESGATARTSLGLGTGDSPAFTGLTASGSIISTGGGETGKFLTGLAGYTVFAFSGGGFDVRAGSGSSSSQNALRVSSAKNFDFYAGNLTTTGTLGAGAITGTSLTIPTTGKINFRDSDIFIGSAFDGKLDIGADISVGFFYDNAPVGDENDGQSLYINRMAAEGDDYLQFYIDSDRYAIINANQTLKIQRQGSTLLQLASNALTVDGTLAVGDITRGNMHIGTQDITNDTGLVTFTGTDISCDELTITNPTDDYKFTSRGSTQLALVNLGSAGNILELFTTSGNKSDACLIRFFGDGTVADITNSERMDIGWATGPELYRIITTEAGDRTVQPLVLQTGANTDQVRLNADGTILMPTVYDDDINGETYRDLLIKDGGQLGYDSCTLRNKKNIRDLDDSSLIYQLRPVKYDVRDGVKDRVGLIAEEVETIMPIAVSYKREPVMGFEDGADGGQQEVIIGYITTNIPETVVKSQLIIPMLKETQNNHAEIEALKSRIEQLEVA